VGEKPGGGLRYLCQSPVHPNRVWTISEEKLIYQLIPGLTALGFSCVSAHDQKWERPSLSPFPEKPRKVFLHDNGVDDAAQHVRHSARVATGAWAEQQGVILWLEDEDPHEMKI